MSRIFQCSYCNKFYANRHNLSWHKKTCCENLNHAPGKARTCNLPAGSKRPMEFVKFSSDEFAPGGVPKSAETLQKLVKLVHDLPSYHEPSKKIESFSPGELAEFAKPIK